MEKPIVFLRTYGDGMADMFIGNTDSIVRMDNGLFTPTTCATKVCHRIPFNLAKPKAEAIAKAIGCEVKHSYSHHLT